MTKNILLVEYDEATIHAIKGIFHPPLFDLAVASDGEAAKKLLQSKSFDLMITAAMLPRFHGFNLSLAVAQEHPGVKIIIISAIYKGLEYRHQALTQYRADDFFEKPLDKEKFKKKVMDLLHVSEDDLLVSAPATAGNVPTFDTARIPAPNFADDEADKLSSADIFGDIIEKIENLQEYEIDLGNDARAQKDKAEERKPEPVRTTPAPPRIDPVKARIEEAVAPANLKTAGKQAPPAVFRAFDQKIDASLDQLRMQQVKGEVPREQMRRIEDDIARKLEDTMSGLGLRPKPAAAARPGAPVAPPPPSRPEAKKVSPPEIKVAVEPEAKAAAAPEPAPPEKKVVVKEIQDTLNDEVIDLGMEMAAPEQEVQPVPEPAPRVAPQPPPPAVESRSKETREEKKAAETAREVKAEKKPEDNPNEVGDYALLGLIARGGMAEIYKAKKKGVKGFEKVIAIKKILSGYGEDDKFIEMLVDEAKIAAELSHPNIVQIYDLGRKDNYYFIAMEYVLGKDLREVQARLRDREKWFPEEIAIFLTLKILEALNYAHKAKDGRGRPLEIVHRDVSPPNILISYNGDVKLTDFGVSKASIKLHQTLSGALKGKLLYMSPEQACGESTIDYRSDLYSAGVLLFELLTGKRLFLDTSEMTVLKKVQNGEIINPRDINPDIDPALEKIILTSLNKDRDKRYQSAAAMIADLEAYVHKKYDRAPGPIHLAHFLHELFEADIQREGIKVELKPLPYTPKVRESARPQPPPEKLKPAVAIPVAPAPPAPAPEFEDTTSINLDEEAQAAPAPRKTGEKKEAAFNPESLFQELDREKKKFPLLPVAAALLVGAVAIGLYLIVSRKPASAPDVKPAVQERQSTPAAAPAGSQDDSRNAEMEKVSEQMAATQKLLDEAKLKQEEELKRVQDEEKRKALLEERRKKAEDDARLKQEEEERLKQEEEAARLQREEEDRKKQQEEQERAQRAEQERRKAEEAVRAEMNRVKEGDIVSLSEVDVQPVAVSTPAPNIPASVRASMPGSVSVMFTLLIDQNGKVETARLLRQSQNSRLDSILTDLVKNWKYRPATKNNVRVKVWKTVQISVKK